MEYFSITVAALQPAADSTQPAPCPLHLGSLLLCLPYETKAPLCCRALAYEALGLFRLALTAAQDVPARPQLQLLLTTAAGTAHEPFQQLPALHALLLAEAATVQQHPGALMYATLNRLLLRGLSLRVEVSSHQC